MSDRAALDPEKIQRLMYLFNQKYQHRTDWDEETLIKKLNQKCRDSAPKNPKLEIVSD